MILAVFTSHTSVNSH